MEKVLQVIFILNMLHIARLTWKVLTKRGVMELEVTIGKIGVLALVVASVLYYSLR